MKHIIRIEGREFSIDSELPITHVLLGQRNEEEYRPEVEPLRVSTGQVNDEERAALKKFGWDRVNGYFQLKPLAWGTSETDAETYRTLFPEPEWTGLKVAKVHESIVYA